MLRWVARQSGGWGIWTLYGAGSLAAVLTGWWVVGQSGGSTGARTMNLVAWGFGAMLAALIARVRREAATWWLGLTVAGLTCTLASGGLSGVHRWIGLGPVRLNGAELLLPLGLAACAGLESPSWPRLLFPLAAALLLALQPDISQATALAAAALVLLTAPGLDLRLRVVTALGLALVLAATALRPDPLAPVPTVEGVIGLAVAISPLFAALAVTSLAAAVLSPLVLARSPASTVRRAAWVLTLYSVVSALAPAAGAYPVPLVGIGVSPILGAWLGIGWLMNLARDTQSR